MNRVATFGNYQSALLNLMNTQAAGQNAQNRVSTQKNATDLVGFGRQSETLTALKGSSSRIQGFLDTARTVSDRLVTQDLAMTRVGDGVDGIRAALGNAMAMDSGVSLMAELEAQFQSIRGGLNMKHQGNYLFSGSATTTLPMTAGNLVELAAAPALGDIFQNDSLKAVSRIAEGATLETGVLAEDLGTDVLSVLRDIQAYAMGPNGPLDGKLTETQKTFLSTQLTRLETASQGVIEKTAVTGAMANQVDAVIAGHKTQLDSLEALVADRTDADMLKAVTDLELSQIAIQASAQVISQLRQASLLNYLT
jgi:flagellar hook-associated protein 3 FlgL